MGHKNIKIMKLILGIILFVNSCDIFQANNDSYNKQLQQQSELNNKLKQQIQLVQDFNKYSSTYKDDTQEMNAIMGKYNLKTIAISERIEIVNEYINYYNIRKNHLNSFYSFIANNEAQLKETGVDTYGWKKSIQDTTAILNNNIEGMKNDVQQILEYQKQSLNQQQQQQYDDLLKILTNLLI